ncbi:hypothetical protein [Pseudokineococcus lusitanus]|uniref:Uncharacterized protein n=1 Tax=Pseudokineococcus lusitanus TaxID=763993 RepID=A0A3N1HQ69_9ACTN|nr:hypothetical protein [Pseudokineococcus lusitanus]ROP44641.1 hypothetical protein EDC03_0767 [Pseudokineococcus lusitanus]
MTTPDDRYRPGTDPARPDAAPSASPTWAVGARPARDAAAPGHGAAAPAGTAADDLDAPATTAAPRGRRGEGLLVAALFTTAGAVLVLALAVGALAVAIGLGGGDPSLGWTSTLAGSSGEGPSAYGDDPDLDALWDACGAGEGEACDELYELTPPDSEYERFGWTCGERFDTSRDPGTCPAELG